ncbi:autotransporter assembly complex protein TamA [Arsenicitalea aurantiaca]|uniref:autotransporter assembly complex protein TamA n=1 Tax=Arsenicitalea aurantiaca TaxID=1783274 RepID=UPI001FCF03DD|nr:autotransporter assembly complex family protein [Arsenicitalea aurantiaca]
MFGIQLFGSQADADADAVIADPQLYTLDFQVRGEGDVERAVRSASALLSDQNDPASGAAGLLAKARGDYRRILAALYAQGYYGGTINIFVAGREATTLPPDVRLPDPAPVTVIVDPGPVFTFNRVAIANRAPFTDDPRDQVGAPEDAGYGRGEVARSSVVLRAEQLALEAWRQQGHPKAEIIDREVVADHQTRTVDVLIRVSPGSRASFGPVAVQGTEYMDPDFVARQSGLTLGEEFDPDEVERARNRLSRLDVFRALRLEEAPAIGADGLLPYTIIVQEQALRRFGVGATYSTVDGLGVEGFWLHRNLFGQAERLRLDAKIAGIGFPIETEAFDYAFGGTFTKPGFWTPDTDLVAAIAAERTVLPAFIETSASARLGLNHFLSDEITLEGAATYKYAEFEDDFGIRTFSTAGLFGGFTFDNRDEPLDATEGFFVNVTAEPYYEFIFGNPGLRATAEARTYFGFGDDGMFVLAARVKAGALLGPDLAEIPPDRLFFAGGGGSVRGYGFKSIGVEGPDGIVTGGRYLLEGSLEARAKVTGDIGAVAFVDAGYVAADTFPGIEDLRVGAGLGLRYDTGLGPLRLDVAIPLNKRDGDPDYALYVGIGQAF